jgi:hypothetical protein
MHSGCFHPYEIENLRVQITTPALHSVDSKVQETGCPNKIVPGVPQFPQQNMLYDIFHYFS